MFSDAMHISSISKNDIHMRAYTAELNLIYGWFHVVRRQICGVTLLFSTQVSEPVLFLMSKTGKE